MVTPQTYGYLLTGGELDLLPLPSQIDHPSSDRPLAVFASNATGHLREAH